MGEIDSDYSALIPDLNAPKVKEKSPFALKEHTHEEPSGYTGDIRIANVTLHFKNGICTGYN